MKRFIAFITLCLCSVVNSQTSEYGLTYGTYYGPSVFAFTNNSHSNSYVGSYKGLGFIFNPIQDNNLYFKGLASFQYNNLSDAQYNQYVINSTNFVDSNNVDENMMFGVLNNTGNAIISEYISPNNTYYEHLIAFDAFGQSYYIKRYNASTDVITANVWFTSNPNNSLAETNVLYKKDVSGNVLWKTFLPKGMEILKPDSVGNIYLSGRTLLQNMATTGTWQENFEVYNPPGNPQHLQNSYLVKLSALGELQWGSYFPSSLIDDFQVHNNHLYVLSGDDLNPANAVLATSGTFQNTKAKHAITKMDTATGNRVWGTYIGDPNANVASDVFNIEVNNTGIYVSGLLFTFMGSSTYYATTNAFKTASTGGSDSFLVKMDDTGNRVWGTYFGSDGVDISGFDQLALTDSGIIITGTSQGQTNNIATTGALVANNPVTTPDGSAHYFAKFDFNGNQLWCSYYGGEISPYNINGPTMSVYAQGNNRFYLAGNTNSSTGIATPGTFQTQLPPQISGLYTGFIARFDLKSELGTSEENNAIADLQLFDNPNNGNFSLDGSILTKQNCSVELFDMSGRLLLSKKMEKQRRNYFNLESVLSSGNYLIKVSDENKETLKTFKMTVK